MIAEPTSQLPSAANEESGAVRSGAWLASVRSNVDDAPDRERSGRSGVGGVLDSIICGDNCDVLGTLPRECIDLVVTSPPYDDLRTYGGHSWDFFGVAWQLVRVLKPGGVLMWNVADATKAGSESGTSMRQALHFQALGLNLHDTMIYKVRGTGAKGSNAAYWQAWEYMFVLSKGAPKTVNRLRMKRSSDWKAGGRLTADGKQKPGLNKEPDDTCVRDNVWEYSVGAAANDDATGHPAVFPSQMAKDHIASWSNPGDVVLDPFSGSGTTCKAAKELERHWIGIDVNPDYVRESNERLSQDVLSLFFAGGGGAERQGDMLTTAEKEANVPDQR